MDGEKLRHQRRAIVGPLVFTSDFDSGNMGKVELIDGEDLEFAIDVAPDCAETVYENGYRTWFFFGLSVAEPVELLPDRRRLPEAPEPPGTVPEAPEAPEAEPAPAEAAEPKLPEVPGEISVVLTLRNMNNQSKLYGDGYRPWCKAPGDSWRRCQDSPALDFAIVREGESFGIRWRHMARRGSGTTYYAFCAPHAYQENLDLIEGLEEHFQAPLPWPDLSRPLRNLARSIGDGWLPQAAMDVFFHREVLQKSLQGRIVELLTITNHRGKEQELDLLPPDLPDVSDKNAPPKFAGRPIVFMSARVHPGETPGSFSFLGALRFLLSDDPRARNLRERFVFKMVPMLNPDGVACGHYRTNSLGLNLNRHYDHPTLQEHEAVCAVKRVLSQWSRQGRLLMYLDMHGHASKRGCFVLANRMVGPGQGWNSGFARLCQLNSPHFDMEQCEFGEDVEKEGKDGMSKQGSGRVAIHRDCRLCNAYTLECNYNKGKVSRPIAPPRGLEFADPPAATVPGEDAVPYGQGSWAQVGEATCVSILDLFGHNCHSRLLNTRHCSLNALLGASVRPRTGRTVRIKDILPQGVGICGEDISARQQACSQNCCWNLTRNPSKETARSKTPEPHRGTKVELQISGVKARPRSRQLGKVFRLVPLEGL